MNVVVENMAISSLVDGKPNPVFKIITNILATMAENEKQNIKERTEMGKIAARNRGVKFGRKEGSKENYTVFMGYLAKRKVRREQEKDTIDLSILSDEELSY